LPILEAVRAQPRDVLLAAGSPAVQFAFFCRGTAYSASYGTNPVGAVSGRPGVPSPAPPPRPSRSPPPPSSPACRRTVSAAAASSAPPASPAASGLVVFPLLDVGATAFAIGLSVTMVIFAVAYGPAGSYLPELLAAEYGYTRAGLGYNLAGIRGDAVPPLLAPGLAASYGSFAIGVMLSRIGLLSLICVTALPETLSPRARTRTAQQGRARCPRAALGDRGAAGVRPPPCTIRQHTCPRTCGSAATDERTYR
jgi:hypothetical protein